MYELKEYLNSINYQKNNLMESDDVMWEKKYPAYVVNKCLAPFGDTIMLINEMNRLHHLDNKLQYDFLLNSLRTRKRFASWMKSSKSKDIECVKEYYGYSNEKSKSALSILNDEQIKMIKEKLNKGGQHGKR
jgi:hypothetical protein